MLYIINEDIIVIIVNNFFEKIFTEHLNFMLTAFII